MAFVKRANVILEVEDELVDDYIKKGYNEITQSGEVIRECIPSDLNQLKLAYVKHKKEIKELQNALAEAVKKVDALSKKSSSKKN